jgi:hypothetical protein
VRTRKRSAAVALIAMLASTFSGNSLFTPTVVHAQTVAPVSQGFPLDAGDLRFIFEQIQVAQAHAAGGALFGPGPFQVSDPQLPRGLRTVDGSFNNLVPGQVDAHGVPARLFGAADLAFPRLTTPVYKAAETLPFDRTRRSAAARRRPLQKTIRRRFQPRLQQPDVVLTPSELGRGP